MSRTRTNSVDREQIDTFLRDHGADRIPHPGGTLLAHLHRVADLLREWGADLDVQYAGLCHAVYGTDGFDRALLDITERETVVELLGARAESIIYCYSSCDRGAVYPRLGTVPLVFTDRFTGREFEPADDTLPAFLEITVANELDVMTHNAELAAQHGAALYELFGRVRDQLSDAAWQACRKQLG
ncbi:DUF6817 domain-containing protein [Nocardia huaxiensis]|uniref:DUF6817 domain-containing protein n=1 Tax=Nocardia huaxiensis TaxID=2755382 RepID=UPI001E3CAC7D|nr:hypothetical protein [Nocardia huaxiensis]UFS98298.1 hypothetical protein LPY97_10570 [Nocardia huaxiensis]